MSATETRHTMSVLDRHRGDTKVSWGKDSPEEIEQAQATFDSLRAQGYRAYAMDKDEKKGSEIKKFDPSLERVMLVPQLVGG